MRKVYNQKSTTITVDGVTMQKFADGASVIVTYDGGEVQKTQGTDGAGVNIATNQGLTLQFSLRENSPSRSFLASLRLRQEEGGDGVTVVVRTGVEVLHMMTEAYISRPAPLNTGDKVQGALQYTIISAEEDTSNLD